MIHRGGSTITKQNKIIVAVVLIAILLCGVVYAKLSNTALKITGIAKAEVVQDFKVYYTGNVIKEEASESYIKVEASPIAKTKSATVNILGLAKKDDYGYAILEIENGSKNIDALSVEIDTNTPTFDGDSNLFDVDVMMCDVNGVQISNYALKSGEKTYVKIFAKLLQTPIDYQEATITAKIIATREEVEEPVYIDKYVCKNQDITAINRMDWTYTKAIIANKGSTVLDSINSNVPYWAALTVIKNAEGKYIITNISPNDGVTYKGSIKIPENGFVLLIYDPQFNLEEIDLEDNEIIVKLNDGTTVESWKTKSALSSSLGSFDIISGKEIVDQDPDDLNLPKGEGDYLYSYYTRAERELKKLTLEEKIAQMYVVGGSKSYFNSMSQYKFGGYLFFADFFENKNINTVSSEIAGYQTAVKNAGGLPLLTSIDEEGYKVSRLRTSGFLAANGYNDFLNSRDLYATKEDGTPNWTPIEEDVWNKNDLLEKLGLNLNFAPDVDIADPSAYIYERTLGQNASITGEYASRVIMASKNTKVSYSLKHFPGYGNSGDTHNGFETDTRTRAEFDAKDLIPFQRGITSGAECVMVSHNLVTCMDDTYPSSISQKVHNVLRNELGYTNIIITDAINMGAIHKTYTSRDAIIHAINAGNDMICISLDGTQKDVVAGSDGSYDTLTYEKLITYVVDAINKGEVSEDTINLAVRRIIAWKMYKGLM